MSDDTSYIVVGFTDPDQILAGFDRLTALAESGPLRIADVEFIHSIQGIPSTVPASRVDPALAGYDAADARLLGQSALDAVADAIPVGSMAAVVLYAGAPVLPALAEWSRDGATVVREGDANTLLA
jgi:hypothetical protein